jgi:hypothetical protein
MINSQFYIGTGYAQKIESEFPRYLEQVLRHLGYEEVAPTEINHSEGRITFSKSSKRLTISYEFTPDGISGRLSSLTLEASSAKSILDRIEDSTDIDLERKTK